MASTDSENVSIPELKNTEEPNEITVVEKTGKEKVGYLFLRFLNAAAEQV